MPKGKAIFVYVIKLGAIVGCAFLSETLSRYFDIDFFLVALIVSIFYVFFETLVRSISNRSGDSVHRFRKKV